MYNVDTPALCVPILYYHAHTRGGKHAIYNHRTSSVSHKSHYGGFHEIDGSCKIIIRISKCHGKLVISFADYADVEVDFEAGVDRAGVDCAALAY